MELELAWAAGFFEGEGSISSTMHRDKRRWQLTMPQSGDRVLLDRFHSAVNGLGNICGPYFFKSQVHAKKPRHIWQAYGKDVVAVLDLIEPYMGGPKLDKAREAREAAGEKERGGTP